MDTKMIIHKKPKHAWRIIKMRVRAYLRNKQKNAITIMSTKYITCVTKHSKKPSLTDIALHSNLFF